MTDYQRYNRMFISALLPFAMLAQSCSESPESALPAQDVTLKRGETLVVIKREIESCTLEVQASRADNNAIVAKSRELTNSESAFVLQFNEITRAEAITLWAVCLDEQKRIVEMGKTVVAVPSSASTVRFETKRLPVSGSWYRMISPGTTLTQNAIWAHSASEAVITTNNGGLRIWNGYGWQESVYADLGCINFYDVIGTDVPPSAFILARPNPSKTTDCTISLAFALDVDTNKLSQKPNITNLGMQVPISVGYHSKSGAMLVYTQSATAYTSQSIYVDPGWALSNQVATPMQLGSVTYNNPSTGRIVSIAVSQFLLSKGLQAEKYPYWILTEHADQQVLAKPLLTGSLSVDSPPIMAQRKVDRMIASKITSTRSLAYEGIWMIGQGLPQLPPPNIPVAMALPSAIAYATLDPSGPDQPRALETDPLNCQKIYTPSTAISSAYILCSQKSSLNWLLTCKATDDGSSVSCQSERIALSDLAQNEKLVGIDGAGPNQLWLIGDQGGIWLYQK